MTYEYGAMSSKYSLEADNKLTAYATMILHFHRFGNNPMLIAIYSPKESRQNDSWLMCMNLMERLDEIFGGAGMFNKFVEEHVDEIRATFDTIKRLV